MSPMSFSALDAAAYRISGIAARMTDATTAVEEIAEVAAAASAGATPEQRDVFAQFVAAQMALVNDLDDLRQRACGLRCELAGMAEEIVTRKRLDRARGIIATRHRISTEAADEFLRRQSVQSGRGLRDLAESVIASETRLRAACDESELGAA